MLKVNLRETTTDQAGAPVSQRDYLGPVIYEDGVMQSIQHADGRVVPGSGCTDDLHVAGAVAGAESYTAGNIATDATVLPTGRLELLASRDIRLQPGFSLEAGGYLKAEQVVCYPPVGEWEFQYFLADHLGNNRVLFADANGDGSIDPATEVLQESHYYAFGLEMEGKWQEPSNADTDGGSNRYRYNGKELNEDLGLYDYGARWYDPAIGRFTTIDPLADQFANQSPYHYAYNNPLRFIDPDGMAADDIVLGDKDAKQRDDAFKLLQQLTTDKLTYDRETGEVFVTESSEGEANEGTSLVRSLLSDDNTATIVTSKINGVNAVDDQGNELQRGEQEDFTEYDSKVRVTGEPSNTTNADGTKGAPAVITLGHELKHADDNAKGVNYNGSVPAYDFDGQGTVRRNFGIKEIETRFFENRLRQERGVIPRAIPIPLPVIKY